MAPLDVIDRNPHVYAQGNLYDKDPMSKHVPVIAALRASSLQAPRSPSIPRWVAQSPLFPEVVEALAAGIPNELSTAEMLEYCNGILYAAADELRQGL